MKALLYSHFSNKWMEFICPSQIIKEYDVDKIIDSLENIEKIVLEKNQYAVGFISYDASPAFDPAMKVGESCFINAESKNGDGTTSSCKGLPLLWFALFDSYKTIKLPLSSRVSNYFASWQTTVSKRKYNSAISKIREYIKLGDTYQVNYTMRQHSKFKGEALDLFYELASSQRTPNCAYIETDEFFICSASPELFFTLKDEIITSSPMKGTAKRGLTLEDDRKQSKLLHNSHKNRAENIMIVDMIRNDIGRIAEPGSVKTSKVFKIEKYPTLWQMTSTVTARTTKSIVEIMKALFPCGSITGAPKIRTMEIISELESTPRGLYTGSIGLIAPNKSAQFNVAIRTVIIDKKTSIAEYGVGGGIVWDSTAKDEYEECLTKTKVLSNPIPEFQIIESLLWRPDEGFFLLDYHIKRMKKSAKYFDYKLNIKLVKESLISSIKNAKETKKIRVSLDKKGQILVELCPLKQVKYEIKVAISNRSITQNNIFLYHKTTNRKLYENIKANYPHYDEVILWNDNGEITEGIYSNIIIKADGRFYTPPVSCGLLPGTYRQYLIEKGEIKEKIVTLDDLKKADELFLINSVSKFRKAILS